MSICNECWGKGWIEKQGVQFDCHKCKGTGVIENEPQTNEEWFTSLSTEEKAKFLKNFIPCDKCPVRKICDTVHNCEKSFLRWLKEKHEE